MSLEQVPPLAAPLRFFLTAPLFALLAGGAIAWLGPAALASRWTSAAVALTHLLTLGFITMVACGAVLQMLPVLSGVSAPHPRLVAGVVHPLLSLGTIAFAAGLLLAPWLLMLGAVSVTIALATFVAVFGFAFRRLHFAANATVRAMGLAIAALGVAIILGLLRALAYARGVPASPVLTTVHLGWGLFGWVGLLIVGVAYQVVPMFQVTPEYPLVLRRWLPIGLWVTLVVWSATLALGAARPARFFAVLLAAGAGCAIPSSPIGTSACSARSQRARYAWRRTLLPAGLPGGTRTCSSVCSYSWAPCSR